MQRALESLIPVKGVRDGMRDAILSRGIHEKGKVHDTAARDSSRAPSCNPKVQSRLCPWPGEATERLNGKVEEHTGTDRDHGEEEKMSQGVRGLPLRQKGSLG